MTEAASPSQTTPAPATLVPEAVRERVGFAPPGSWIKAREVNYAYKPQVTSFETILLEDRQCHAEQQLRYERIVRRMESLQGVQGASQWRLDFDPATQRVIIHSLSVRRDGVSVESADPARVRFLQREENLERYMLDGWVTLVVLLEDVRVGDIIDCAVTIRSEPRLLPANFWHFTHVPDTLPLAAFYFRVCFAPGRALRWRSSGPLFEPISSEGELNWHAANIPLREEESEVPGWNLPSRWAQVSDVASWKDVAAGVANAWPERFDDEDLNRTAREIARRCATPEERANQALILVQDEIRYLSSNIELGGQVPCEPGLALTRRYGDCKDKSHLLAHLLRRLGIPARPVLVNAQLRGDITKLLPTPNAFNHAIVEFILGEERRWVDPTLPCQGGGAMNRHVPDFQLGLPLGPGVEDLEKIEPAPGIDNHLELRETFYLDRTARASLVRVQLSGFGAEADHLRREFAHEGVGAIARRRERIYQQLIPSARRLEELAWQDERSRNRFTLVDVFDVPAAIVISADQTSFSFEYRAHLIQSCLAFPESMTRRHPLILRHPCNVEQWITIELDVMGPSDSPGVAVRGSSFRAYVDYSGVPGRSVIRFRLQTFDDEVEAGNFPAHRARVRELWPSTQLNISGRLPLGSVQTQTRRRIRDLLIIGREKVSPAEPPPPAAEAPAIELAPALKSPLKRPPLAAAAPAAVDPDEPDDGTGIDDADAPDATARDHRRNRRARRRARKRRLVLVCVLLGLSIAVWLAILASRD